VLVELHVRGLGVIEEARLEFGEGLTALTGETGAGKTLVVDALALVLGGRPRRGLVRQDASALVEACFVDAGGEEVILARELPSDGRARAWIDGRLCSVATLSERSTGLCDIHGQHEHQSLVVAGTARRALDAYGEIDSSPVLNARRTLRELVDEQDRLGGDPIVVAREIDLLSHQVAEIDAAGIEDPDELDRLLDEAKVLESAGSLKVALNAGLSAIQLPDAASPRDQISTVRAAVSGFESLKPLFDQLCDLEAELDEVATSLRESMEEIDEDPRRLAEVNDRLAVLHDLCRRYGPKLGDVRAHRAARAQELEALRAAAELRESIEERLVTAAEALRKAESAIAIRRRAVAPDLQEALHRRLATLALDRARLELVLEGADAGDVSLLFSANPGQALQPVGMVASGGELARLMLAIRLVMPGGPSTMIFDEVDAGIGGATATTLAQALVDVASTRQVLVVTHLAQIAAMAHAQISVVKEPGAGGTVARATALAGESRISELARMLSGSPESEAARRHAAELLGNGPSPTGAGRLV